MSDEESFVILCSSPMSSLELDGHEDEPNSAMSSASLESDKPGSSFGSLKQCQLKDLQNAQEILIQTPEPIVENTTNNVTQGSHVETEMLMENLTKELKSTSLIKSIQNENNSIESSVSNLQIQPEEMAAPKIITPVKMVENPKAETINADSKLWSRSPQVERNVDDMLSCLSLENCAVPSPLDSKKQHTEDINKSQQETLSSSEPGSLEKTTATNNVTKASTTLAANNSLASSFIMGEINADVLKSSVYSQFPSISMNSSPEDVVKLQNMVTENIQLKVTLDKVNNTMRLFHNSSLKWKEQMNAMEIKHQQELADCHKEIEMLRETNHSLKLQIEAVEIARIKDREETIQKLSEKSSLIDNMRVQIVKLEKQQMNSFQFVDPISKKKTSEEFKKFYVPRDEHELKLKELEIKLSELLASNLDLKDMEKQYIDELNCLKVNLTSAEELIKANNATIIELNTKDSNRLEMMKELERSIEKQNERIQLLEHQNQLHRKDFEMEKESCNRTLKEKQKMLQDLRNLQKRNQELIESQQSRLSTLQNSGAHPSFISGAAAAETYFNNPQRPIRNLPFAAPSSNPQQSVAPTDSLQLCPICNKAFRSLTTLQSHVNDCIDKN